MSAAQIHISLGKGRKSARAKQHGSASWRALAELLNGHVGTDAWWSPHAWKENHRRADDWISAAAIAIDVDYYDSAGQHSAPPREVTAKATQVGVDLGVTALHPTPRGVRLIWVLSETTTDRTQWTQAASGLCERLDAALAGTGLRVDRAASLDVARMFWAPLATVDGVERTSPMQVVGEDVDLRDLLPDERESGGDDLRAAVRAYRDAHPLEVPKSGGQCPFCRHDGCFGRMPSDPTRWYCFSSQHEVDGGGAGLRGSRGWHGDVLDLHAHAQGCSRMDLLSRGASQRNTTGDASSPGGDPSRDRLRARLRRRDEILSLASTRWLIKGYATCSSVVLLGADPNLGKSTLVNGWAHCIWMGNTWLGHGVRPGSVLFLLGEDVRGASLRARAWEAAYGRCSSIDGRYIEYADKMPPLCEHVGQAELRRLLEFLRHEHGAAPAMVVIDTLSTVWGNEPENAAELAAALMSVLSSLAEEFGCTFVLIHHLNKPPVGQRREITLASIRGAGAFVGSADDVLVMEATDDGGAKLYGLKARNTDKAPVKYLRVERVVLGVNEDGDEVSSVILVEAAEPAGEDPEQAKERHEQQVWNRGEEMVQRAVEALRKLEKARSRSAIATRMTGKRCDKFAGIDDAIVRGLIVDRGTDRKHEFVVADSGPCVSCKTPHTPEEGTGNRSPAEAGPDPVPQGLGTGSPEPGTGNHPKASFDDGTSPQPQRRRKAKAGRP